MSAEPVEPRDPAHMRKLKELTGLTETQIYMMDGGLPEELVRAYEAENNVVQGEVVGEQWEPQFTGSEDAIEIASTDEPLLKLENLIHELEEQKRKAPADEKKRWDAFALRLQGFSVQDIAYEMDKSVQLIYAYLDWCTKQLPNLKDYLQEFTVVSIQRLEAQYRQLSIARAKGDLLAHKVSLDIIDQQAKLVGAHKVSIEVDNRVTYVLEGVNMDEL